MVSYLLRLKKVGALLIEFQHILPVQYLRTRTASSAKKREKFPFMNNPSRFDTQDDMVEALRTTNFDALVLDVFDRTQNPFTKRMCANCS